jgi:hypothetical protein
VPVDYGFSALFTGDSAVGSVSDAWIGVSSSDCLALQPDRQGRTAKAKKTSSVHKNLTASPFLRARALLKELYEAQALDAS